MSDRLHPFLLALTMLDLAFVHTTGAVSGASLAPLWGLALLSPWLRRLQRFVIYRVLWNAGVLLLFALLARHATSTGLANLLEDGLLLAALCQVHLLNNVGKKQQPDLVFLNSLLIAFVTSYFGSDGPWFTLFVLHAFAFAPALQARARMNRPGSTSLGVLAITRSALPQALAVAGTAVVVFAVWPRDFDRQGWLHSTMASSMGLTSGVGERIRLDVSGAASPGNGVVMRISPLEPGGEVPTHWRSVAYSSLVHGAWVPQNAMAGRRIATDPIWRNDPDGAYRRPLSPDGDRLLVEMVGTPERRLPVPLTACELHLRGGLGYIVDPRPYGVIALAPLENVSGEPVAYEIRISSAQQPQRVDPLAQQLLTRLPETPLTELAGALDERRRSSTEAGETDAESTAIACADWLRTQRTYELPGRPGFAESFTAFMNGDGAGHCEYFASALTLMLRRQGIPARVMGGYLATERTADGTIVVRSRHAHAWVEMLRPDGTWLTLDATPPSDGAMDDALESSWWTWPMSGLQSLWSEVSSFGDAEREQLLARIGSALRSIPTSTVRFVKGHLALTATLLALPLLWIYCRARQRRRPIAVVSLLKAARSTGLRLEPGETPREMLARAQTGAIPVDRIAALEVAVRQHEHQRYRRREDHSR